MVVAIATASWFHFYTQISSKWPKRKFNMGDDNNTVIFLDQQNAVLRKEQIPNCLHIYSQFHILMLLVYRLPNHMHNAVRAHSECILYTYPQLFQTIPIKIISAKRNILALGLKSYFITFIKSLALYFY